MIREEMMREWDARYLDRPGMPLTQAQIAQLVWLAMNARGMDGEEVDRD